MCDPELIRTVLVLAEAGVVLFIIGVFLFSGAARLWVRTASKSQPLLQVLKPALLAFVAVAVVTYVIWGFTCGG